VAAGVAWPTRVVDTAPTERPLAFDSSSSVTAGVPLLERQVVFSPLMYCEPSDA
jgi:hypothetical protein